MGNVTKLISTVKMFKLFEIPSDTIETIEYSVVGAEVFLHAYLKNSGKSISSSLNDDVKIFATAGDTIVEITSRVHKNPNNKILVKDIFTNLTNVHNITFTIITKNILSHQSSKVIFGIK